MQIRGNGDLALFQALGALLLQRDDAARPAVLPGPVDRDFIDRHTSGFSGYAAHLRELDWSAVYDATGVTRAEIERLADRFASSSRTIICWAMGITQHRDAVATIKEITNLASSKATYASQEPGCARYEDIPTSRVTEPWASGRSCHRTSRPPW